jgi:hypothetical protein
MDIAAVPLKYNGVQYRSSLEADWAATFTHLGIYFEYEPQQWRMPSGAVYECDFYLPTLRTYCEAKGPHNERIWKPREFAAALKVTEYPHAFQVVILRPAGPSGSAAWELADDTEPEAMLAECDGCLHWGFTDFDDLWQARTCRRCGSSLLRQVFTTDGHDGKHMQMQHANRKAA